jgi:hypothetical protein
METVKISKKKITQSVLKMISDKKMVRAYLKGETPIQTLTKQGIKFAKPL